MKIGEGNGKVYLGIPRERIYFPEFVDNRDAVLQSLHKADLSCGYYQAGGHRVDFNRDRIVEQFLNEEEEPEWLLMLDSDMEHPFDIGQRLVRHQKEIVGALYFHRGKSHDPLTFKVSDPQEDRYGRMTRYWTPMRDEVYDFLLESGIPPRDTAVCIDGVDGLREVDAIGTGAILIHRSVLEAMAPGPWFEYETGGNSEDLMFCANAKEKYGFKVYCDFSTICGHMALVAMGYTQFRMLYEKRGYSYSSMTKEEAVELLSEFANTTKEDAQWTLDNESGHSFGNYWDMWGCDKNTPEAPKIYRTEGAGYAYIPELISWNGSKLFNEFRRHFISVRKKNVIEIGAGIGTLSLQMLMQDNNVTAVEVNPILRKFIEFRHERINKKLKTSMGVLTIMGDEWMDNLWVREYDMAFAVDVFEHLTYAELNGVIEALSIVIKPGGYLYFHNNWGQQDIFPMHHDHSDYWDSILRANDFYRTAANAALRM